MGDASFIDKLYRTQISNTRKGINHDIYDKRLTKTPVPTPGFTNVPKCIYFYYLRIDKDGKVRVDHYLYPAIDPKQWNYIYPDKVEKIIRKLALNARPSGKKDPPKLKDSKNFEPIPWRYRSWIAIFLDERNWRFVARENGHASVVFNPDLGDANHSFFDARDCCFDMPLMGTSYSDERYAIYFINHMKGSDGYDLGDDPVDYKFNINCRAEYANSDVTGAYITFDPGGTNQGPPIDP